jgi:hypothetical protein
MRGKALLPTTSSVLPTCCAISSWILRSLVVVDVGWCYNQQRTYTEHKSRPSNEVSESLKVRCLERSCVGSTVGMDMAGLNNMLGLHLRMVPHRRIATRAADYRSLSLSPSVPIPCVHDFFNFMFLLSILAGLLVSSTRDRRADA